MMVLPPEKAIHYYVCSSNFHSGKDIPSKLSTEVGGLHKKQKLGRRNTVLKIYAFWMAIDYSEEN